MMSLMKTCNTIIVFIPLCFMNSAHSADPKRAAAAQNAIDIFLHDKFIAHLPVPAGKTPVIVIQRYIAEQQKQAARAVLLPVLYRNACALACGITSVVGGATAGLTCFTEFKGWQLLEPAADESNESTDSLNLLQLPAKQPFTKNKAIRTLLSASLLSGIMSVVLAKEGYKIAIEPRESLNRLIQEGDIIDSRTGESHLHALQALRTSTQYHSLGRWLCLGIIG